MRFAITKVLYYWHLYESDVDKTDPSHIQKKKQVNNNIFLVTVCSFIDPSDILHNSSLITVSSGLISQWLFDS